MTNTSMTAALVSILFAVPALADVQCDGPSKQGNTWSLVCSEDGKGDADYACDYAIELTNSDGQTSTVSASGTVGQNQQGIVIWSGIEFSGSAITDASISSGSCTSK